MGREQLDLSYIKSNIEPWIFTQKMAEEWASNPSFISLSSYTHNLMIVLSNNFNCIAQALYRIAPQANEAEKLVHEHATLIQELNLKLCNIAVDLNTQNERYKKLESSIGDCTQEMAGQTGNIQQFKEDVQARLKSIEQSLDAAKEDFTQAMAAASREREITQSKAACSMLAATVDALQKTNW